MKERVTVTVTVTVRERGLERDLKRAISEAGEDGEGGEVEVGGR